MNGFSAQSSFIFFSAAFTGHQSSKHCIPGCISFYSAAAEFYCFGCGGCPVLLTEPGCEHEGGESYQAFFRTEGDIGFDIFAAIFYLLTRYEEYLPFQKDSYGRFDHRQSVAFRNDFLDQPLINTWLEDLRVLLASRNPDFKKPAHSFSFLPTYDIDMAMQVNITAERTTEAWAPAIRVKSQRPESTNSTRSSLSVLRFPNVRVSHKRMA